MMIKRTRYFSTLIIFSISTFILTQLFNLAANPVPKPQRYKLDKLERMVEENQQSLKTLHHKFFNIETRIASSESANKASPTSQQISDVSHQESSSCVQTLNTKPIPGNTQPSFLDQDPVVRNDVYEKFKDKVTSTFAQGKRIALSAHPVLQ